MFFKNENLDERCIEKLNNLVKELNSENRILRTSSEYKRGKNISLLLDAISHFNVKPVIDLLKLRYNLKLADKYCKPTPFLYNYNTDKGKNQILSNSKIAIYTCIFGNYDKIYEPKFIPNNCDFYIITDQFTVNNSCFKVINPNKYEILELDNIKRNRFFKMNPHLIFPDYEYSIYIDGNIEVYSDLTELVNKIPKSGIAFHAHNKRNCIYNEYEVCKLLGKGDSEKTKKQINSYKEDGFPNGFGMVEANVIARQHNNPICKDIMADWWKEYSIWGGRDQISLPYVIWKHDLKISEIATLGENVHVNPGIRIYNHKRG